MAGNRVKNMLSGSVWGIGGKLFDSIVKFAVIPLLITHYGKKEFALVSLVLSLNAYLRMMDLGMNVGGVRFFATWLAQNDKPKVQRIAQASFMVYGGIGIINALVFLVMAFFSAQLFKMENYQQAPFVEMLILLALSTTFSWMSFVVEQLLNANEEFAWLNKMAIVTSICNLSLTLLAVYGHLSLVTYFFLYILSTLFVVPFNVFRLKNLGIPLKQLLKPRWHNDFREVVRYSLAVFAMGVFQASADSLRPILLGAFAGKGIEILADYRITQTITMFVVSMGGVFLNMLVPVSAKIIATGDQRQKNMVIHRGTVYITLFLCLLVGGLILNSQYLLGIYVGEEYNHLSGWLTVWLITLLLNMHTFPVSGLILSSGKTGPLIWSSAIGCSISILTTVLLAPYLNIGAAVLGYLGFVAINLAFTYGYYMPRILQLPAKKLFFGSFGKVVLIETVAFALAWCIDQMQWIADLHLAMLIRSALFTLITVLGAVYLLITAEEWGFMTRKLPFLAIFRH